MNARRRLLIGVFLSGFPTLAAALGTADFLRVTPDGQSAALGNSGVTNANSAFAAYANPALLGRSGDLFRLAGSQTQWFMGVTASHYALSSAWRTSAGRWGAGVFFSDWRSGEFSATDASGRAAGSLEYSAQNLGAAFSGRLRPGLHVGAAVKQVSQSFSGSAGDAVRARSVAFDAGVSLQFPFLGLELAAAVQNIGPDVRFIGFRERLPRTLRAGLQMPVAGRSWIAALEAIAEPGRAISARGGLSFSPSRFVTLRFGYDTLIRDPAFLGFTGGAGVRMGALELDYAATPFDALGLAQRISVAWRFGRVLP